MRLLVTGGAGYIGSVLCRLALARGHEVVCLDAAWFGLDGIEELRANPKFLLWEADIRHVAREDLLPLELDAVIHGAGFSNDPTAEADPTLNDEVNHLGTESLALGAAGAGIPRFTFMSSASVYDGLDPEIRREEDAPLNPRGAYSRSKWLAEEKLRGIATPYFKVIVFRQGTVSGLSPRMRFDLVVNAMIRSGYRTGTVDIHLPGSQRRPLVSVHDVALAHVLAAEASSSAFTKYQVFNLAAENLSIRRLGQTLANRMSLLDVPTANRDIPGTARVRDYQIATWAHRTHPVFAWYAMRDILEDVPDVLGFLTQCRADGVSMVDARFENLRALRERVVPLL